jgi:uncharacterized membrane protein
VEARNLKARAGAAARALVLWMPLSVGCHHDDAHDGHDEGSPTRSACSASGELRYEPFGRSFMEAHCMRCHASHRFAGERHGAPVGVDFDRLEVIRGAADAIDAHAAAGPASINTVMPPDDVVPIEERYQLGEWLACGAPD